ncbi:MAG: hypothetical protein ACI9V1_000997 [Spirosomataceae bacterium]|jgi:hypothetical protein
MDGILVYEVAGGVDFLINAFQDSLIAINPMYQTQNTHASHHFTSHK